MKKFRHFYAFLFTLLTTFTFAQVDWVGNLSPNKMEILPTGSEFIISFDTYKANCTTGGNQCPLTCKTLVHKSTPLGWDNGKFWKEYAATYQGNGQSPDDDHYQTIIPIGDLDNGRYSFECACSDDNGVTQTSSWDYVNKTGELHYFTVGTSELFRSMIILDVNESVPVYYDMLQFQPGNEELPNQICPNQDCTNTPDFGPGCFLYIAGAEANIFKNSGGDVTGISFLWNLTDQSGTNLDNGVITTNFRDDCPSGYVQTFPGGGSCYNYGNGELDQRWDITTSNIELLDKINVSIPGCYDITFSTETYTTGLGTLTDGPYTTSFCYSPSAVYCIFPVELSNFNAALKENIVDLNWETETESNSAYFLVERSFDGIEFVPIGNAIDAAGYSEASLRYSAQDEEPSVGLNYYRLKIVDLDGTFEHSEVEVVRFEPAFSSLPDKLVTGNDLTFDFFSSTNVEGTFTLLNTQGQVVYQADMSINSGKQTYTLPVQGLANGAYILSLDIPYTKRHTSRISVAR